MSIPVSAYSQQKSTSGSDRSPTRRSGRSSDGFRGRLIQLIDALEADPCVTVTTSSEGILTVPNTELTLRAVARRCRVSSPNTAGEWLAKWRERGWLTQDPQQSHICFNKPYREPRGQHQTSTTSPEQAERHDPPPPPTPDQAGPDLHVLLTHLAYALERDQTELITRLDNWISKLVDHCTPARTGPGQLREPARTRPTTPRGIRAETTRVPERSEGESPYLENKLTHSPSPYRAMSPARATARSRQDLEYLITPTLDLIRHRHLTPMTNWRSLEEALRPFTDEQIAHAQNTLAKQIHASDNITSPIGLLVRQARDNNPDYFPPVDEPRRAPAPTPLEHEPTTAGPLTRADHQASISLIREQLNPTNSP